MRDENEKSIEKKFAFVAKVFAFKRIRLIWLDIIVKRVNHEKKKSRWLYESAYFRTNKPWRKNKEKLRRKNKAKNKQKLTKNLWLNYVNYFRYNDKKIKWCCTSVIFHRPSNV